MDAHRAERERRDTGVGRTHFPRKEIRRPEGNLRQARSFVRNRKKREEIAGCRRRKKKRKNGSFSGMSGGDEI